MPFAVKNMTNMIMNHALFLLQKILTNHIQNKCQQLSKLVKNANTFNIKQMPKSNKKIKENVTLIYTS